MKEIPKAEGERCISLASSKGCGRYETRPQSCADFLCMWMRGMLSDKDRPDKLGLVIDVDDHPKYGPTWKMFEVWERAASSERAQRIGKALAEKGLVIVFRKNGTRAVVGGPSNVVERFKHDLQLIVLNDRNVITDADAPLAGKMEKA